MLPVIGPASAYHAVNGSPEWTKCHWVEDCVDEEDEDSDDEEEEEGKAVDKQAFMKRVGLTTLPVRLSVRPSVRSCALVRLGIS